MFADSSFVVWSAASHCQTNVRFRRVDVRIAVDVWFVDDRQRGVRRSRPTHRASSLLPLTNSAIWNKIKQHHTHDTSTQGIPSATGGYSFPRRANAFSSKCARECRFLFRFANHGVTESAFGAEERRWPSTVAAPGRSTSTRRSTAETHSARLSRPNRRSKSAVRSRRKTQ